MTGVALPQRQEEGFAILESFLTDTVGESSDIAATKRALAVALGTVAHEMATPLAGVRLDLQSLQRMLDAKGGDAAVKKTVLRIFQHVSSVDALMHLMLASVSGPITLARSFSDHSALDVVNRTLRSFPRVLPVTVHHPDGDFLFHGSDMLMTHVLMNLLKNAERAIHGIEAAGVDIRLAPGAEANHLTVRDTGRGIPKSFLPYLFQPFRSRAEGGSGLGLAFCRRVIAAFGGTITCRSEEGRFTEFDMVLPVTQTARKAS